MINQTLTVDQQLQVANAAGNGHRDAAPRRSSTRSTTTMGTNFTKELLTEIPNARDVWAAMAQAPGIQMHGFDVGGSHTGTSDRLTDLRLRRSRTRRASKASTPPKASSGNAGYFDFGSVRRVPGRRRRQQRRELRARRRRCQHQRQVRRRSLLGQLVQRLAGRCDHQRQRAGLPAHAPTRRDEDGYFSRTRADARQPDRSSVRRQLQRRRPAVEEARRGSSTATA